MSIRINLDVMMARRKIGLTELSQEVDVTMANLSILKNNKARAVRFSTLNAICKALDCQPGDILEYVPEGDGAEVSEEEFYHEAVEKAGKVQPSAITVWIFAFLCFLFV